MTLPDPLHLMVGMFVMVVILVVGREIGSDPLVGAICHFLIGDLTVTLSQCKIKLAISKSESTSLSSVHCMPSLGYDDHTSPRAPQKTGRLQMATILTVPPTIPKRLDQTAKKCLFHHGGQNAGYMVALYTPIEDLIAENDQRCEESNMGCTKEQDHVQRSYIELVKALPWVHDKLAKFDHKECEDMLRQLKQGVDSACGDNIGTFKELIIASWVNIESEWRWDDPVNLEHGLMKSKLLVLGFEAIFTSPSSANEVDSDGNGANILENNQHAQRQSDQAKVKTCVASIIGMRKVTPCTITYVACQASIGAYL
ncbi:hypothetical protein BDR07DRAFT_1385074 [Suillus spraguei]|nr:hypothetical protein BDR07DRAFT_1385074 [Suillus spraguei]